MATQEWPAEDYAIGSYIQASIANHYLKYLELKPTDSVLDIGCGNGSFSRKILDKIQNGHLLGIDASGNMLALAKQELAQYPNASLQQDDVLAMPYANQFDYITSFWCLQWCAFAIEKAFLNMYTALKHNARLLALFPSGDDPFVTSFYHVKESGKFPVLEDFKPPVDYQYFQNLEDKVYAIPFKHIKFERIAHQIQLPSLDVFRKFVNGIAFFQGQIPNEDIYTINEALIESYNKECQEKFSGEYWFNFSIYLLQAEK